MDKDLIKHNKGIIHFINKSFISSLEEKTKKLKKSSKLHKIKRTKK